MNEVILFAQMNPEGEGNPWSGLMVVMAKLLAFLPFYLMASGGSKVLVGMVVLVLDGYLVGHLGKALLRWQRRIGIPEPLIGIPTIVGVLLVLMVFNGVLLWCIEMVY